jgi:hypothetical protein
MPVQWVDRSRMPRGPGFLQCPPNRVVLFLTKPEAYPTIVLHWDDERGVSVPCMGEDECRVCPAEKRIHVYAGVLVLMSREGRWLPVIADLGSPTNGLAHTDYSGAPLVVGRRREKDRRSELISYGRPISSIPDPPENAKPFDVRPTLMRRWGLFADADELMREAYYEQGRLPFPTDRSKPKAV